MAVWSTRLILVSEITGFYTFFSLPRCKMWFYTTSALNPPLLALATILIDIVALHLGQVPPTILRLGDTNLNPHWHLSVSHLTKLNSFPNLFVLIVSPVRVFINCRGGNFYQPVLLQANEIYCGYIKKNNKPKLIALC